MTSIIQGLKHVIGEIPQDQAATVVTTYNGQWRQRTKLMAKRIGLLDSKDPGIIPRAMEHVWKNDHPGQEPVPLYERYTDICFQTGDWWAGEARWEWIAEVENNIAEVAGTVSDLLRIQAKRKLGVFYASDQKNRQKVSQGVFTAFQAFRKGGFTEPDGTLYEILVLPDTLPPGGFTVCDALLFSFAFAETTSPDSITPNPVHW